ncbi:MAG: BlaI/MecI/CopY family transcriptional regulator [Clostridium sp.]|nr:BlaI/MecI/CopY family transcriptional regulator [Clostridium sp.]MCM1399782.1 BlaI/MecI/CopY family transcriptional regulator [Clostridium sp.]MCM1459591.1 BlaI/MecI/CopY family transcriptional regulator [Bacteroides sp.]
MVEGIPSENEWMIMEIVWKHSGPVTASMIIKELEGVTDISKKTIRVMINRLVAKGVLTYTVDAKDARVYHYSAACTKEECLGLKSERFVKHYFGGNASLAVASFLSSANITEEQLEELNTILRNMKDRKKNG